MYVIFVLKNNYSSSIYQSLRIVKKKNICLLCIFTFYCIIYFFRVLLHKLYISKKILPFVIFLWCDCLHWLKTSYVIFLDGIHFFDERRDISYLKISVEKFWIFWSFFIFSSKKICSIHNNIWISCFLFLQLKKIDQKQKYYNFFLSSLNVKNFWNPMFCFGDNIFLSGQLSNFLFFMTRLPIVGFFWLKTKQTFGINLVWWKHKTKK